MLLIRYRKVLVTPPSHGIECPVTYHGKSVNGDTKNRTGIKVIMALPFVESSLLALKATTHPGPAI